MKKDRNMYYQNYSQGGVIQPNNMMFPQQYGQNYNYTAYGPNVMPENFQANNYQSIDEDYETRISRLERQIKKLNQRLVKLETSSDTILEDDIINTNNYMI